MGEFEKQHPLLNAIAKTISELYVHKHEEAIRLKLLKKMNARHPQASVPTAPA